MNMALRGLMVKFDLKSELGHNAIALSHCFVLLNILGGTLRHEISGIGNRVLIYQGLWKQSDCLSALRLNVNKWIRPTAKTVW